MIKNLDHALDWIYSFTNLEISRTKKKFLRSYKLKKIGYLLNAIGNPHKDYNIIHIAGTKGKGSIAYILNNIFINSGFKVGLYTSPHLFKVNERIQINNTPITDIEFINLVNFIKPVVESIKDQLLRPTFFDIFTAIAFYYFHKEKVNLWIIETGLGGRLDSTNIVKPILSIITSISKEHTKILGNSLSQIASEKGGIIKKDIPVLISKNRKNVVNVLKEIAVRNNSPFFYLNDFVKYKFVNYSRNRDKIYQAVLIDNKIFKTSMLGIYQVENLACSKLAIDIINRYNLLKISKNITFNIKENLYWKGRLTHKFFKNIDILFDGAHNRVSASVLRKSILKMVELKVLPSDKIVSIIGILKGKDYTGILENIMKFSSLIFFIEPYKWRDCKITNYFPIYEKLNKSKNIPYIIIKNLDELISKRDLFNYIIKKTKTIIREKHFSFVVTGSLYTVARLMEPFQNID